MTSKIEDRRSSPAVFLHWAVALLVLATFGAALIADEIPSGFDEPYYLIHASLGVTLLLVLVVAVVWSLIRPARRPSEGAPAWQHGAARLVEVGLFVTTLAAVLLGRLLTSLEYPLMQPLAFGVLPMPPPVHASPLFKDLLEDGHEFFAYAAVILAGLHVAAALWHRYAPRDSTPLRALPETSQPRA